MRLVHLREAPKEGKGWLFAVGELAMPTADLAHWDISIIDKKLLKPYSYGEMETEVRLKNGLGTQYGLGLDVASQNDRRALAHGGEVSGFTAENVVFPDDRAAVVVLTNQDAARAWRKSRAGFLPYCSPHKMLRRLARPTRHVKYSKACSAEPSTVLYSLKMQITTWMRLPWRFCQRSGFLRRRLRN